MANKVLCRIGGIISIISVFLPIFSFTYFDRIQEADVIVYYWMFGQIVSISQDANAEFPVEFYFQNLDFLGTICMMLIIIGAMLVIMNSDGVSNAGLLGGILIILIIFLYVGITNSRYYYLFYSEYLWYMIQYEEAQINLSYGFYVALIGGFTSIGGSIIPKRKKSSNNGE